MPIAPAYSASTKAMADPPRAPAHHTTGIDSNPPGSQDLLADHPLNYVARNEASLAGEAGPPNLGDDLTGL